MDLSWLPNWKIAKEYPDFNGTSDGSLAAWEFLRRNLKYQEAWDHYEQTAEKPSASDLYRDFGIGDLCNPATKWERNGCIIPLEPGVRWRKLPFEPFPDVVVTSWSDRFNCLKGQGMTPDEFNFATQPQALEEVVVKFNLLNSIDSQFETARMRLELMREVAQMLYKKAKSEKANWFSPVRSRSEYTLYLRLLDAEVKVKTKSTAAFLRTVQPVLAPAHPDSLESAVRKLRKNLNQAHVMRDHGYRSLALVTDLKDFTFPLVEDKDENIKRKRNQSKQKQDLKTKRFCS